MHRVFSHTMVALVLASSVGAHAYSACPRNPCETESKAVAAICSATADLILEGRLVSVKHGIKRFCDHGVCTDVWDGGDAVLSVSKVNKGQVQTMQNSEVHLSAGTHCYGYMAKIPESWIGKRVRVYAASPQNVSVPFSGILAVEGLP